MNEPSLGLFGLVSLVIGLYYTLYPRRGARRAEKWDAIGSKRDRSDVEPKSWRVSYARFSGVFALLLGVLMIAAFVFSNT